MLKKVKQQSQFGNPVGRSVEEESEGAAIAINVLHGIRGRVGVLSPLRFNQEVFCEVLMSQKEMVVTPEGSGGRGSGDDVSDVLFCATEFAGLVLGEDLVEDGASGDGHKIIGEDSVVGICYVLQFPSGLESEGVRENGGGFLCSLLVVFGKVGETCLGNPDSLILEF